MSVAGLMCCRVPGRGLERGHREDRGEEGSDGGGRGVTRSDETSVMSEKDEMWPRCGHEVLLQVAGYREATKALK